MRKTGAASRKRWGSSRSGRLTAVAFGVGLLITAGAARAGDDDDDDQTFEEKIISGLMRGIGATNMDNSNIDYRERSPLVVPRKLELPPPSTTVESTAPNWPKDPDDARRKAAIAARKKDRKDTRDANTAYIDAARPLTPAELSAAKQRPAKDTSGSDSIKPGDPGANPLLPSDLGYNGGLLGMFRGNKAEATQFKQEPTRESLTQPPPGYQTPSTNFMYGTGPQQSLNKQTNIMTGKEQ